ncbi:UNVERIFIED_CONTAM: hypothetical protein Sangu_2420100 [Sesamum angustifolium]|uniref:Uncharacterized protein n=1 Tax=Sesamum angustifolium TaxID=2727405 RepID=A0AAW2KXM8_9LAMI
MSFLAGRLASTEGSYFLQESKQAVTRILQNQKNSAGVVKPIAENSEISSADVLPEVLRHSLPPQIFHAPSESLTSSFSGTSKWALKPDPKGVTFGPKRWQLPNSENSVLASTANDLRHDKYTPINPEKLKAAAAGLTQIGSAFAVATAVVFGGATVIFGLAASKLEVHNTNDIQAKGKDLIQPKFEMYRDKLVPLRTWAEAVSKKWHLEREEPLKEKPLIKELSRKLGAKTST